MWRYSWNAIGAHLAFGTRSLSAILHRQSPNSPRRLSLLLCLLLWILVLVMPAYHTQFQDGNFGSAGNLALLPLRTKIRGPAPAFTVEDGEDLVDEALSLYRANCFFRNFEIQGAGDRTLIYAILFIGECLGKIGAMIKGDQAPSLNEVNKMLNTLALGNFALPGEPGFPLNAMYDKPKDRTEADTMRAYLSQVRQEIGIRLPERIYASTYPDTDGGKRPSKWWISFQKRKFMNKAL